MAGGYKAQPSNGFEKLVAQLTELRRRVDSLATVANNRNGAISGGSGLTIGVQEVAPTIRLSADVDTQQGRILFSPSTGDQQHDWAASILFQEGSGTGAGSLFLNSPAAPVSRFDDQPAQIASVTLNSGDGTTDQASGYLSAGDSRSQVSVTGGLAGIIGPRINLGGGYIEDDSFSGASYRQFAGLGSLVWPYTVAEARVRDATNSAYIPIRASAFTVTSTVEAKQDVADLGWSPLDVVKAAKARSWRYQAGHGDPDRTHVGPMAEDLPAELVDNTSEVPALDLGVLVGVLWGAVQELAEQVAALSAGRPEPFTR